MTTQNFRAATASAIAASFVQARLGGEALFVYPGVIPETAQEAYACQDAAIALWPESVVGWKVGLVASEAREHYGEERVVGPVFSGLLRHARAGAVVCPIFVGGFAAVEAEFVFRIANDVAAAKHHWTAEQAADVVAGMYVGVEIASSPLASINDLGPTVIASDFGNNFGLVIGAEITAWRTRALHTLRCEVSVEGNTVGQGAADSIPGGPLSALAFALSRCAQRGYPLKAGHYVCTGATTGVHTIRPGETASVWFHDIGTIQCKAVGANKYVVGGRNE